MQDNDLKQRTPITFGLPSADVDFLAMLQEFIERDAGKRQRIVPFWVAIRIDGVHQCVIESESWCRLEFEGGTSKVEIVGRDAEGEVVIATYLPTYDGPKTEAWRVSLPWGDEVICNFEYDDDDKECVRVEAKRIVKPKLVEKRAQLTKAPQQEFSGFDRAYVEKLRNGDPATVHHFFAYFEKSLNLKLRARAVPSNRVEDLRREVFIRVIAAVRKEGGVRQPDQFGAFVNSICNNVLHEHYQSSRNQQINAAAHQEIPDMVLDLEGMLVSNQFSERVRKILSALPARDRDLLRAVFLEEKDKDTVCRDMGVDRNYLRALLHRTKDKFKDEWANLPPVWDNLLNED
jgi:RNA polymerase sigma-70 factor, ECF subfamily